MLRILTLILFSTWVLGQDELLTTSFEGENLDWITLSYQGDDPGARDWRTQTDSFERGHTGIRFMEIDGNYDENFCAPIKSKILLSPPIQTGYSAELELRFWQKFYAAQNVTHDKKIVVFDVSVGIPVVVDTITRAEIKLAAGASSSSPWLERVITIPGMANKTIQIGWWYVAETGGSTSTVCADTWKIDDVRLVGNQSQGPGETIITSPATDKVIRVGDSLTFEGHIEGGEPGSTLIWEFCADNSSNCLYSGRPVGSRQFTQPGVYEVVAYSRSPSGEEDLTPARRTIRVVAGNIRPTVQITSPRRRSLTVRVGDPIPFSGQATDADGSVQNYFWLLKPGDQTISGQASVEYAFQKTGHYGVICAASDNDGGIGYDFRLIEVIAKDGNIPPDISIQSPQDGQVFQVNETFSIIGKLTDYDGTGGRIQWDFGDGRTSPSLTIQNFKYSRPGRYTIQLTARDGNRVVKDQVTIYVVNRERVPAPEIVQPTTDLLIQPGQSVFLEGVVPGSTALHKNLKWTFGDGRSTRQTTPGRVTFSKEGTYQISLDGTTDYGVRSDQKDTRQIIVKKIADYDFEPNNSIGQASEILPGQYGNLDLFDSDYFKVKIPRNGMTLNLNFAAQGSFTLNLYDQNKVKIRTQRVGTLGSARLEGLPQGYVYIHCEPDPGKAGLSFGMGVSVMNPNLYFTDLAFDGQMGSSLGLVNPNNDTARVELIAYDVSGSVLAKVPFEIPAYGKCGEDLVTLFGDLAPSVSWVRADSSLNLNGYSCNQTHDGLESYALSASKALSEELFIPHVAQQTNQWYTKVKVINGSESGANPSLVLGSENLALANKNAFTKSEFDVLDLFNGTLPVGAEWGWIQEDGANLLLAGNEVFGKVDGNHVAAGLGLADTRRDNPNFFYIENDIFFTHIARDTAQFWTGIALVNVEGTNQTAHIMAYGPEGNLVGEKDIELESFGKRVELAESLLEGIGSPADVDWVRVKSDFGVVGYELFGTYDNKRMAGLEASSALKTQLIFPFLDPSGKSWHGIALVNVNDTAQTVTLDLHDSSGAILLTVTQDLAANQKKVSSLTGLFGELPANGAYVRVRAGMPLAGFELFGDQSLEMMAGLVAE